MDFTPPILNRLAMLRDPSNMEGQYNTALSPEQEAQFQQWRSKLPQQLQYMGDYDLKGAFLANAQQSANAHFTDQFKKPNHPSFSVESQYSRGPSMVGGTWQGEGPDAQFTPSAFNALYQALGR